MLALRSFAQGASQCDWLVDAAPLVPVLHDLQDERWTMVRVASPTHVQFSQRLNTVPVGVGLSEVADLVVELHEYCDVLLGRVDAPVQSPYLDLCEVATAYYARALEMDMHIHNAEREGFVLKGSELYRFRTGTLRSFIDMSKKMSELGSRRLSQEDLLARQRLDAG